MRQQAGAWRSVGALALALTLGACGGGGGGGQPSGGGGGDPVSLSPKTQFTAEDTQHFLRRTHWGGRQADLDAIQSAGGLASYIDQMVQTFAENTPVEQAAFQLLVGEEDPVGMEGMFPGSEQVQQWWLHIMTHTPTPFQEVLAMFWHDHFALGLIVLDNEEMYWMPRHINLLRRMGNGNLRDFLYAVSTDWAMLDWLDGFRGRAGDINENWAREFWELFTLGVDNGYTQADIQEAARAFTGYRRRGNVNDTGLAQVVYEHGRHDTGNKTIFGLTLNGRTDPTSSHLEYLDVINLTLDNRPVAEFICKKLWEHFAFANPPAAIVNGLAAEMRLNDYDLAPVLAMMFKSQAFYSSPAKVGLVKSPVDFAMSLIRGANVPTDLHELEHALEDAGQLPTAPPNVAGWEQGVLWLSAQNMIERANLAQEAIYDREEQAAAGADVADLIPPGADPQTPPTSEAIVRATATRLGLVLADAEVATYVTVLDTFVNNQGVPSADPLDLNDANDVDERMRALLFVMTQHPGFHVR